MVLARLIEFHIIHCMLFRNIEEERKDDGLCAVLPLNNDGWLLLEFPTLSDCLVFKNNAAA